MAVFNYENGEINVKVVYYGPGLSGKTTNLEHIYSKLPKENKGKMVSMKTRTDRTLFFDFLPIDVGEVNKMKLRFLLYTVPGQVYYNATRKLVLKGVDALVFVADSSPDRMADNKESLQNLEENMNDLGMTLQEIPWVIQFNKRDLPDAHELITMTEELNFHKVPAFEAVATVGTGVYETLEGIGRLVFSEMQKELSRDTKKRDKAPPPKDIQEIKPEVVAHGRTRECNSEAGESESLDNAEKREEEHASVSEFVDNVLKEDGVGDSINMQSTRDSYEEYGHLVDLNDDEAKAAEPEADEEKAADFISDPLEKISGEPDREDPLEKISGESDREDPLEKISDEPAREKPPDKIPECTEAAVEAAKAEAAVAVEEVHEEKVVRVPVTISEEEIRREVPVKVILEVKVTSG